MKKDFLDIMQEILVVENPSSMLTNNRINISINFTKCLISLFINYQ